MMRIHSRRSVVALWTLLGVACSSDRVGAPVASVTSLGAPLNWQSFPVAGYSVGLDYSRHHGGRAAAYLTSAGGNSTMPLFQNFAPDAYRGKRVRWSAWVQQVDISGGGGALVLAIMCPGQICEYDGMESRRLIGTADWHQVAVVLDVPANAVGIYAGATLTGQGTLLIDDARFDIVGSDVPSTNTLTAPEINGEDSAAVAHTFARDGFAPGNLDFEGFSPPAQSVVDWLSTATSTLATTDPAASLADLAPLKQMIGGAHVVGLGEGTHGTREFFQMKHRILEMLVRDMGFTVFAMEATTPEANDMNRYVLTGEGDPHVLLSHLYFWTWNTEEVFDMIQWMRGWNVTAPAAQRVQFLGFDMQSPGQAMDSVQSFATRVHRADSAYVAMRFNCMNPYRNRGQRFADLSANFYAGRTTADDRALCAQGLQEVYDLIGADIQRYPAAAPADTFQLRLHDARLIQQFEHMIAVQFNTSSARRDSAMAENVDWIRGQFGQSAKIVLWAHDAHINKFDGSMGGYLRDAYGSDYVNLGFLFADGSFNAKGIANGELKAWRTSLVPPNSIEAIFAGTNKSAALFDARRIASGGSAAAPLAGPLPMRSIGAAFDPSVDAGFFGPVTLPATFDLLVFLRTTSASTLLPFVY